MTAIATAAPPPGPRRAAAVDLGLWLAALAAVFALALGMDLVAAPNWVRVIVGEPVEMLFLLAVSTWLLRRRGEGWGDVGLRLPPSIWRTLGLVAVGFGVVLVVAMLLVFSLYPTTGLPRPNLAAMTEVVDTPWRYAVMIGLVWTTVAFGEEMLFRGFAFSRLERIFGGGAATPNRLATAGAWLGQGVIFGLLHGYQGIGGILSTGVLGLVLGGVYLVARRNLLASILLHGLMDTLSLTALFYMATHGMEAL